MPIQRNPDLVTVYGANKALPARGENWSAATTVQRKEATGIIRSTNSPQSNYVTIKTTGGFTYGDGSNVVLRKQPGTGTSSRTRLQVLIPGRTIEIPGNNNNLTKVKNALEALTLASHGVTFSATITGTGNRPVRFDDMNGDGTTGDESVALNGHDGFEKVAVVSGIQSLNLGFQVRNSSYNPAIADRPQMIRVCTGGDQFCFTLERDEVLYVRQSNNDGQKNAGDVLTIEEYHFPPSSNMQHNHFNSFVPQGVSYSG